MPLSYSRLRPPGAVWDLAGFEEKKTSRHGFLTICHCSKSFSVRKTSPSISMASMRSSNHSRMAFAVW